MRVGQESAMNDEFIMRAQPKSTGVAMPTEYLSLRSSPGNLLCHFLKQLGGLATALVKTP